MKLPQTLLQNRGFIFSEPAELISAMGEFDSDSSGHPNEIISLFEAGLPPIVSTDALCTMFGYNPGFIYSMLLNPSRHYRKFKIPKGRDERLIIAPKVGLKGIQTWLSYHFQNVWTPIDNVHGFVRGKSHISAAARHLGARWVASIDIENFFPSICVEAVKSAVEHLGYKNADSVLLISHLCCLNMALVQGAPTSPVISNIVLRGIDKKLEDFCTENNFIYTRYADDIVVSGKEAPPAQIIQNISKFLIDAGWTLSNRKTSLDVLPNRLKVHGLLVHGEKLRLTKGYRNRIRAYRHLHAENKIDVDDISKVIGHLEYSRQVDSFPNPK